MKKRTLARITGFVTMFAGLYLVGTCASESYQAFYAGETYRVVMPNGTAGVKSGGAVKYKGIDVGVVTETRPFLQLPEPVQEEAWRSYHSKQKRLLDGTGDASTETASEVEGVDITEPGSRSFPKSGMALVQILLKDSSLTIGKNTYAGGSAYYMTGQGYITIQNPARASEETGRVTYIPSFVDRFWQDRYLDMLLRFEPWFRGAAKFQKRFENWYAGTKRTSKGTRPSAGREQLNRFTSTLNELKTGSEFLKSSVGNAGRTIQKLNRTLDRVHRITRRFDAFLDEGSGNRRTPVSKISDETEAVRQGMKRKEEQFEHDLRALHRAVRGADDWVQGISRDTLSRGLIQDVWD